MEYLETFINIMLHLDTFLTTWAVFLGPWLYVLLFVVIFCETGLVITPFLPGDSLLFALGALTSVENSQISFLLLAVVMIVAGILGDATNYAIGKFIGPKVFKEKSRFLKIEHLQKTQDFYDKHGGKTIILARYIPIIRTFAPFVAGIGKMKYSRFAVYNVVGAISWVLIFLTLGHLFGNIPAVKRNFHIVIFAIIGISFAPVVIEYLKSRKSKSGTV